MESSSYPMLFSPIKVGTTEVKNRVFMPPVSTNLADHGYVTDDLVDHYRARAKGGVGLIITEVVTVEPIGLASRTDIRLELDIRQTRKLGRKFLS